MPRLQNDVMRVFLSPDFDKGLDFEEIYDPTGYVDFVEYIFSTPGDKAPLKELWVKVALGAFNTARRHRAVRCWLPSILVNPEAALHLVDALGNLDRAIVSASKLAKVTDYKVVTYPEPGDKLDALMRRFKGSSASAAMSAAVKKELGTDYDWDRQVANLRKMNGKAMMAMPFLINVQ